MAEIKIRKPIATFKQEFNPITLDPNWDKNGDVESSVWTDRDGIHQNPSADFMMLTYGAIFLLDPKISCKLKLDGYADFDLMTSILMIRGSGPEDCINLVYQGGEIQVMDMNAGVYSNLNSANQMSVAGLIDPIITLEAVGDTVFVGINDDLYEMPIKTTLLAEGFFGMFQASWNGAVPLLISSDFTVLRA